MTFDMSAAFVGMPSRMVRFHSPYVGSLTASNVYSSDVSSLRNEYGEYDNRLAVTTYITLPAYFQPIPRRYSRYSHEDEITRDGILRSKNTQVIFVPVGAGVIQQSGNRMLTAEDFYGWFNNPFDRQPHLEIDNVELQKRLRYKVTDVESWESSGYIKLFIVEEPLVGARLNRDPTLDRQVRAWVAEGVELDSNRVIPAKDGGPQPVIRADIETFIRANVRAAFLQRGYATVELVYEKQMGSATKRQTLNSGGTSLRTRHIYHVMQTFCIEFFYHHAQSMATKFRDWAYSEAGIASAEDRELTFIDCQVIENTDEIRDVNIEGRSKVLIEISKLDTISQDVNTARFADINIFEEDKRINVSVDSNS